MPRRARVMGLLLGMTYGGVSAMTDSPLAREGHACTPLEVRSHAEARHPPEDAQNRVPEVSLAGFEISSLARVR